MSKTKHKSKANFKKANSQILFLVESGLHVASRMQKPRNAGFEFQLGSIFSYNFVHMMKLSANTPDLSANKTKVVCKCRI